MAAALFLPLADATSSGLAEFQAPALAFGDSSTTIRSFTTAAMYSLGPTPVHLFVTGTFGTVEILNYTRDYAVVGGSFVDPPRQSEEPSRQRWERPVQSVRVTDLGANATLVVELAEAATGRFEHAEVTLADQGVALVSGPHSPYTNTLEPFESKSPSWPNLETRLLTSAMWNLRTERMRTEYSGPFRLYVTGASVEVSGPDGRDDLVQTGMWNDRASPDKLSEASAWRHTVVAVVIQGRGRVLWDYAGPFGYALGESIELQNLTQLTLPSASLNVSADGLTYEWRNQSVIDVAGRFNATDLETKGPAGTPLRLALEGRFETIQANRISAEAERFDMGAAVTASSLVLLVVALWMAKGRLIAAFLQADFFGFALRARIHRTDLLQSHPRRTLYKCIDEAPGLTNLADIRRLTNDKLKIGVVATYYHLRKLQAGGYIHFIRSSHKGRILVASTGKAVGLEHRIRSIVGVSAAGWAMAEAVARRPGANQKELIAEARQIMNGSVPNRAQVSSIALFKWLKKFERVLGPPTLERTRSGRNWRYFPSSSFVTAVGQRAASATEPSVPATSEPALRVPS